MSRLRAAAVTALLAGLSALSAGCGGGEEALSEPEPPQMIDVQGTWHIESVGGHRAGSVFDTINCSAYTGGNDSTTMVVEDRGRVELTASDTARVYIFFEFTCDGQESSLQLSNVGTYTSREDSLFFNWLTRWTQLEDVDWAHPFTVIATRTRLRYPVGGDQGWDTVDVDVRFES